MSLYIANQKVARIDVSSAGGVISSPGASTSFFVGSKISLDGDSVTPHGTGQHAGSVVIAGINTNFYIQNILVVVNGDSSTCSHSVTA